MNNGVFLILSLHSKAVLLRKQALEPNLGLYALTAAQHFLYVPWQRIYLICLSFPPPMVFIAAAWYTGDP